MNQLNDMNFCRASHSVCLVDRFIYACAGSSDIEDGQKTFERYDIQQNLWDRMPDCHFPAIRCLMVPLHDRYIYKFGGISPDGSAFKDIEYYDIKEKEWIIISDPVVKAEPEVLKRLQFRFMAMMGGVQVNHNSILVVSIQSRYLEAWTLTRISHPKVSCLQDKRASARTESRPI